MAVNPKKLAELTEQMRRLGLPEPEEAAREELESGAPILATYSFLKWSRDEIVRPDDHGWIDRALDNPDENPVLAPALKRLFDAGADRKDVADVARVMQYEMLAHVCFMLDGVALPGTVPVQEFGLFQIDDDDEPIARIEDLHEEIEQWNPSLEDDED